MGVGNTILRLLPSIVCYCVLLSRSVSFVPFKALALLQPLLPLPCEATLTIFYHYQLMTQTIPLIIEILRSALFFT